MSGEFSVNIMIMSDSSASGRWIHRLAYGTAGLALAHFALMLSVAWNVSKMAVVLGLLALAISIPRTWLALSRVPRLNRPSLRILCFLVTICLAHILLDRGNYEPIERKSRAYLNATIFTGERDGETIDRGVVLVDADGMIVDVGQADSVAVPRDYESVDLSGKFLMPGLINAHGHLMLPSQRDPDTPMELGNFALPDWMARSLTFFMASYPGRRLVVWAMERNTQRAVRAGVTTLRAIGDPNYYDVLVRERLKTGRTIGPRLLVSGPILCVTGGHAHQIGLVVDGPDEARRAVRASLRRGVDVIKIASTGGVSDSRRVGEAGELQMTPDEIAAVVDEAHRRNVLVTSHAQSTQGVKEALQAGVDNIEHGAALDPETIALFLNNPKSLHGFSTLHPTLSMGAGLPELTDEIRDNPAVYVIYQNGQLISAGSAKGYRSAISNGVKVGLGTDAGLVDHAAAWKELSYFVEHAEVSNREALYMGTLGTAESIGVDSVTGSIEPGKSADIVVLDRDPLEGLSALAEPYMVVAQGILIKR